jgi:hypothetical protein
LRTSLDTSLLFYDTLVQKLCDICNSNSYDLNYLYHSFSFRMSPFDIFCCSWQTATSLYQKELLFSHRLSFSEHPGIAGSFHMIKRLPFKPLFSHPHSCLIGSLIFSFYTRSYRKNMLYFFTFFSASWPYSLHPNIYIGQIFN